MTSIGQMSCFKLTNIQANKIILSLINKKIKNSSALIVYYEFIRLTYKNITVFHLDPIIKKQNYKKHNSNIWYQFMIHYAS